MANEDGSSAEGTSGESFGERFVKTNGGDVSIDWSFLDRGFRGIIFAWFVSIIGIITGTIERIQQGVANVTAGVASFFAQWGIAADFTAAFATAQRSLDVFPAWLQFIAALVVVLGSVWALDKIWTVITDA